MSIFTLNLDVFGIIIKYLMLNDISSFSKLSKEASEVARMLKSVVYREFFTKVTGNGGVREPVKNIKTDERMVSYEIRKGVKHGVCEQPAFSESLTNYFHYNVGVIEGPFRNYTYPFRGKIGTYEEGYLSKGLRHGKVTLWNEGTKLEEVTYFEGEILEEVFFRESDNLFFSATSCGGHLEKLRLFTKSSTLIEYTYEQDRIVKEFYNTSSNMKTMNISVKGDNCSILFLNNNPLIITRESKKVEVFIFFSLFSYIHKQVFINGAIESHETPPPDRYWKDMVDVINELNNANVFISEIEASFATTLIQPPVQVGVQNAYQRPNFNAMNMAAIKATVEYKNLPRNVNKSKISRTALIALLYQHY